MTYANLKPDWFIKIATANQSVAMAIIRLQKNSLGALSFWIALSRVSLFSFVFSTHECFYNHFDTMMI